VNRVYCMQAAPPAAPATCPRPVALSVRARSRRMSITRVPLREQVHTAVVERILRGDLPPGARLRDTVLAAELGVSRTPVREALVRLEREGFLAADVGRGFSVRPLQAREVQETYPIVWTLETLAVRLGPPLTEEAVAELAAINASIVEAGTDPERRIELDMRWHRTLVAGCGNGELLKLIDGVKAIIWRYEYAYMQHGERVPESARAHDLIARAAARGERDAAAALLEAHWKTGIDVLVPWLWKNA
jgi:DNA-binding GntR family transcriptional regulator